MKYREVAILDCEKRSDGWSATAVSQLLKRRGFKAKRGYSPYVGHVAVVLDFNRLTELASALKVLHAEGIIGGDIRWRIQEIRSNLAAHADYAGYVG